MCHDFKISNFNLKTTDYQLLIIILYQLLIIEINNQQLVCECLANEVEFINSVKYEESVWMKVCSERGKEALYIGCVYMLTDSTSISVVDSC